MRVEADEEGGGLGDGDGSRASLYRRQQSAVEDILFSFSKGQTVEDVGWESLFVRKAARRTIRSKTKKFPLSRISRSARWGGGGRVMLSARGRSICTERENKRKAGELVEAETRPLVILALTVQPFFPAPSDSFHH